MFGPLIRARLANRPYLRAVIKNTGWLFTDRVLRVLLGVLVSAWVARYLGPDRFGQLAYVVAFIALFQAFATIGADGIVVRDIAQSPEESNRVLGTVAALRLTAGAAGWGLACMLILLLRPGDWLSFSMAAMLGGVLLLQASDVIDLWFQSQTQSWRAVLAKAVGYCGGAILKIALILTAAPLWAFIGALLLDAALAAAALAWAYRRFPTPAKWTWDNTVARRVLRESWPFLLASLAIVGYMRIDQLMLRELAGERELGLYAAVLPFSQAWYMVPMVICSSFLPRMSTLRESDPAQYEHRLQQLISLMAWAGIGAAIVVALLARPLVELLLGSQFSTAVSILRVHAMTNVFVFLGMAQSVAILHRRTPRVALYKTLAGLLACVVLNLYLVPRYGALGSAWAAVLSFGCSAVLSNIFFDRAILIMQLKALVPFHVPRA